MWRGKYTKKKKKNSLDSNDTLNCILIRVGFLLIKAYKGTYITLTTYLKSFLYKIIRWNRIIKKQDKILLLLSV